MRHCSVSDLAFVDAVKMNLSKNRPLSTRKKTVRRDELEWSTGEIELGGGGGGALEGEEKEEEEEEVVEGGHVRT